VLASILKDYGYIDDKTLEKTNENFNDDVAKPETYGKINMNF